MSKPGLPQGTRDFGADTVHKRQFIFQCIRKVFELAGFEPLETPAMENLETLLGKYGDEGDKLLFKVLNNGLDHASKRDQSLAEFEKILAGKNNKLITERALRYDLTIPFARYVATHHQELAFPFKRYQIQPVWRADRPQKGRYREFYQCDADVVGSRSLLNEVELTRIYLDVFEQLKIPVEIRINHRKILAGLAEACGGTEQLVNITTAIDKLDKIGIEKVKLELSEKNLNDEQILLVEKYLKIEGSNEEKIDRLRELLRKALADRLNTTVTDDSSAPGPAVSLTKGLDDIQGVLAFFDDASNIILDPSLARGLNYYTGIIFEVRAKNVSIGSIGGGGRYDDLTGLFGVPNIPGVGISFGVDRIYDVMEELKLFPATVSQSTEFLFFNLGREFESRYFHLLQQFRKAGIRCELYPESAKFDKQFKYAEKKKILHVIIIGGDEFKNDNAQVKNLASGVQEEVDLGELVEWALGMNR